MCNRRDILHPGLGFIAMKWDEMKVFGTNGTKIPCDIQHFWLPLQPNNLRVYMEKFWQIVKYSAKCNVWVLLALALIQPFGIENIKEGRIVFIIIETLLCFISIIISASIATIVLGKMKDECTSRSSFLRYIALANLINIPLLGAFLLSYNSLHDTGSIASYWFWGDHFTLRPLCEMSMYVAFLSFFMVIGQYLFFRNSTLQRELDEIKAINQMLEQRQERLEQEEDASTTIAEDKPENQITITGQGQDAIITLCPINIIYVESMANYADICYIADNETKHTTLRITLKQIRETLEHVDCIVQCHRAFLVNINFVVAMTNRNPGYCLQLFGMDKEIPVSRANVDTIKSKL